MFKDNTTPNFIIGGATAAGTSFLSSLLSQHPDVYLPKDESTEPHFFSLDHRYNLGVDWYKKWFDGSHGRKAVGDRSSSYLHFPSAAARIKLLIPDVKLIFLLRDPVDRMWAHYRYMVLRGIETLPFDDALAHEKIRRKADELEYKKFRHFDYLHRSKYGTQIAEYLRFFPFKQILIINSKNLKTHTIDQLKKITDFLEISPISKFKIPSEFPSLSVRDPRIQFNARKYFGATKSRNIIESIRHEKSNIMSFVGSKEDYFHICQIKNNIHQYKEELPKKNKIRLENILKKDKNLFFNLARNHIDFKAWW